MRITKTQFLNGLACARRAYFDVHSPELAARMEKGLQLRLLQGQEVGRLSRLRWQGAVVNVPSSDMEKAAGETQRLIASGERVLFEATFIGPRTEARLDVLERLASGGWHAIEVKSSKEAKPEHVADLAFQVLTAEEAGLQIERASLLLVSGDFVSYDGSVDPEALFRVEDLTKEVRDAIPEVSSSINDHLGVVQASGVPTVVPNVHCVRNDVCPYVPHCFKDLPANDVTTLPRISFDAVTELHGLGVRDIKDIPSGFKLSKRQELIAGVVRSGEPFLSPALGAALRGLKRPLHFIDFEACNSALPLFPGGTPYMVVPFQWSDHVIGEDGGVEHREFLHTSGGDPRPDFARTLWEALSGAGTVLHYSSYEKTRIAELARAGVPYAADLEGMMRERAVDLEKIVLDHVYFEGFRGRSSIKAVYPALVAKGGYTDLEIQGGEQAAAEYKRMLSPATVEDEAKKIASDLLEYCKRDTQAMVDVFSALRALGGVG